MFEQILDLIKKYDKIIIHRHKKPDGDAIGSQEIGRASCRERVSVAV